MDPYALFESIAVTEEGAKRIEMAREAFAQLVKALDMPSAQRETSIALTKLQEASDWAVRSYAVASRKEG